MAKIGFHGSHEQFPPSVLLRLAKQAEQAGFTVAMCSDHFMPWSERQGHSGFAFAWLGAALQATRLPFGVVNAPGQRYHPAIVAQAAATLAEMFPGRFWLSVGSGQALNEHITGDRWPTKPERNARLKESVDVIRALFQGEMVSHDHPEKHGMIRVKQAKLYTRPKTPPPIIGAAITAETAGWLGGWADGLITITKPIEELREVVEAFRDGGGRGKPVYIQSQVSYARTDDEARQAAHDQWRTNVFDSSVLAILELPQHFDAAAEFIGPDELDEHILISSDTQQHVAWIEEKIALGIDHIYLHNVGRNQEEFIDVFGERVLPALAQD